ncbi:hypothetical protein PCH_Pc09g00110 [Penicillium rubens Wisconsin 54-1255]|uniref:Uncharacterized protein n=1 Tax=Penicillium rubens (strain ATCC 28089 / DSM 1075 / NRRL 1951 / Wisconsin 54-1255) TaxID=500485 RepID=B6GWK7_PENRW|nr:hypothetical protein PCH_Pc09g00110 [Penicillium rubens Wisconsin 54-1255]
MIRMRLSQPCKIRPRDAERLYFKPKVSKPRGRRRRRHGDCGPSFSPIFHLRVNPRGLSEVATREMRRSVLLRLHLNRREHDRALLRDLDCRQSTRTDPTTQTIQQVLRTRTIAELYDDFRRMTVEPIDIRGATDRVLERNRHTADRPILANIGAVF